jgi:hypothetical protein
MRSACKIVVCKISRSSRVHGIIKRSCDDCCSIMGYVFSDAVNVLACLSSHKGTVGVNNTFERSCKSIVA